MCLVAYHRAALTGDLPKKINFIVSKIYSTLLYLHSVIYCTYIVLAVCYKRPVFAFRRNGQPTDTDSIYFSITKENLDDCVPPHVKPNYFRYKLKWLTSEVCPNHDEAFIQCKIENKEWDIQPCCSSLKAFDKRKLGKMKVKYKGKNQVCLASKSYFCQGETNKQVCKGVSIAQNPLTFNQYLNVLETNKPLVKKSWISKQRTPNF